MGTAQPRRGKRRSLDWLSSLEGKAWGKKERRWAVGGDRGEEAES
jgi:hypothetical protein